VSLVLIPVRLVPAVSTEEAISFRQIHEPSGTPIKYVKGVRDGDSFTEVPHEEIIKVYEHAKGHHVLIHPKEIDELKLEAKHTIDMVRFVDEAETTAAISRNTTTSYRMVMKPTKAIRSSAML
jgi:DNA end-binding protein Ku